MLSSINSSVVLAFTLFLLPLTQSQFVNTLPRCIRDCINQSQYSNCQITDVACICRASAGNFLPDLVNCMHGNCVDIDNNVLLAPLQFTCELAGAPIPDSAIKNAEDQPSSLESQVTKTVTMGPSAKESTVLITTTEEGSTHTLVYPITIEKTTTISGEPSTVKATTPASSDTSPSPSSTEQISSTTLPSTGVAGTEVTSTNSAGSSGEASETSTAPPVSQTNSAPFTDTNSAARRRGVEIWLGFGVLLIFACVWL